MKTDDGKGEYGMEKMENESAIQHRLAAMFSANKDEITVPKIYFDMTNDFKAAAILDEIMFWTLPKRSTGKTSLRVKKDGKLWLAVRRSEWWDRKRITERQSDAGIAKLIELDLVEKDVFLFDGKPTVHLRLKMSSFISLYTEKLQDSFQDNDDSISKDIADLYEMMGFPNQMVNSNLPNGEMLNLPNGEIINSLQQPPNTSSEDSSNSNKPKRGSEEWKEARRKELEKSNPELILLRGSEVTQEAVDSQEEIDLAKQALDTFEVDMAVPGNWNWYPAKTSDEKAWKYLREFVVEQYKKDKKCFQTYQTWRTQPFVRGAMSNLTIRRNPENFPASWTDFLASNAMYGKKENRSVEVDDNDIPMSY